MTTPNVQADAQEAERHEADDELIYCHRRNCPGSSGLRCYRTGVPICTKCAVRTPVGYISKDAQKQHEDRYYNIRPVDYALAGAAAFFTTLLVGWPLIAFLGRLWFLMFFVGPVVGGIIGEAAGRVIRFRRGRYTRQVVSGAIVAGLLLLLLSTGNLLAVVLFGAFATGAALARLQVAL